MSSLDSIYTTYRHWQDPLSQRLLAWIEGDRNVTELRTKILVNPFFPIPLQSPVLEGKWVWEQWTLNDYLTLSREMPFEGKPSNLSPFDEEPLREGVPHEFAVRMIQWMNPESTSNALVPKEQSLDAAMAASDECKYARFAYYWWTAQTIVLRYRVFEATRRCEQNVAKFELVGKKSQEAMASSAAASSASTAHHQTSLEESKQSMEQFRQSSKDSIQSIQKEGDHLKGIIAQELANSEKGKQAAVESIKHAQLLNQRLRGKLGWQQ